MPPMTLEPSPLSAIFEQKKIPGLTRIQVEESDSVVILTGTVPSFYHKQLAQEALISLLNGRKLVNHLLVVRG